MHKRLEKIISHHGAATVAVSGGVDSMTLAYAVNQVLGDAATMVHAVSPAVPAEATSRVKDYASKFSWRLQLIDAKEFNDDNYINNPVNRCFYCKSNLYKSLASIGIGNLMSGTNKDDLSDWRPGLEAAENYGVCHPFIEADMSKVDVRSLAQYYGLAELSVLPASPCLSSRVETGIAIEAKTLDFIDRVEGLVRKELAPKTVRCRIRGNEIAVCLDEISLRNLTSQQTVELSKEIEAINDGLLEKPLRFRSYKQGDAFLRQVRNYK